MNTKYVASLEERSSKTKSSKLFQDQFDYSVIGQIISFKRNKVGGEIEILTEDSVHFTVTYEFENVCYLTKADAETVLKNDKIIKIYGWDSLANWDDYTLTASYLEVVQ
jgi:hypothetical protein